MMGALEENTEMLEKSLKVLENIEILLAALVEIKECQCHARDDDKGWDNYECPRCKALESTGRRAN